MAEISFNFDGHYRESFFRLYDKWISIKGNETKRVHEMCKEIIYSKLISFMRSEASQTKILPKKSIFEMDGDEFINFMNSEEVNERWDNAKENDIKNLKENKKAKQPRGKVFLLKKVGDEHLNYEETWELLNILSKDKKIMCLDKKVRFLIFCGICARSKFLSYATLRTDIFLENLDGREKEIYSRLIS